jgi:hypothetical protein
MIYMLSLSMPFDSKPFRSNGLYGGSRTSDLCRDRTITNRNPFILKRTDGSDSAQKHLI